MEKLKRILQEGNYSCVVDNYDQLFTYTRSGISDLYDMVKNKPCFLKGAFIADQIVGKGAAALMILGNVSGVYAEVISLSALILLRENGIETDFGRVVPYIRNHNETDWCPIERICYCQTSPKEILRLIDKWLAIADTEIVAVAHQELNS